MHTNSLYHYMQYKCIYVYVCVYVYVGVCVCADIMHNKSDFQVSQYRMCVLVHVQKLGSDNMVIFELLYYSQNGSPAYRIAENFHMVQIFVLFTCMLVIFNK